MSTSTTTLRALWRAEEVISRMLHEGEWYAPETALELVQEAIKVEKSRELCTCRTCIDTFGIKKQVENTNHMYPLAELIKCPICQLDRCTKAVDHRVPCEHNPPAPLESSEQYRMQMNAISTASLGYWDPSMGILPEYDTPALRDVAALYAKYKKARAKSISLEQLLEVFRSIELTGNQFHDFQMFLASFERATQMGKNDE